MFLHVSARGLYDTGHTFARLTSRSHSPYSTSVASAGVQFKDPNIPPQRIPPSQSGIKRASVDDSKPIWERGALEPARAYAGFMLYRDMDAAGRRLRALTCAPGSTLARWSRKYKWGERCAAWDAHLYEIAATQSIQSVLAMRHRHALVSSKVTQHAHNAIVNTATDKISIPDAIALLKTGVSMERAARGVSEQETRVTALEAGASGDGISVRIVHVGKVVNAPDTDDTALTVSRAAARGTDIGTQAHEPIAPVLVPERVVTPLTPLLERNVTASVPGDGRVTVRQASGTKHASRITARKRGRK